MKIKKCVIISTVETFKNLDKGSGDWRSAKIGNYLRSKGLKIKIITSNFNHYSKTFRKKPKNQNFILLKSIAYKKNTSIKRLFNYIIQVPQIIKILKDEKPDLCLITLPPLEHLICIKFSWIIGHNTKFLIDVRDLWPEIFEDFTKHWLDLGFLSKLIQLTYYRLRKWCMKDAYQIFTISPLIAQYLEQKINKPVYWFPHPKKITSNKKIVFNDKKNPIKFCYFGKLSKRIELLLFLKKLLKKLENKHYQIIVGGDGELKDELIKLANVNKKILYLGYLSDITVKKYMDICDYGILPVPKSIDFDKSYPNKFLEYCASGLPTISNRLSSFIHDNLCIKLNLNFIDDKSIKFKKLSNSKRQNIKKIFKKKLSEEIMKKSLDQLIVNLEINPEKRNN